MRIIALVFFGFLLCCATTELHTVDESSNLHHVCLSFCEDRYADAYGVQAQRVRKDLVRCKCRRHRGDRIDYINVREYEEHEDVNVDVLPY